MAEKGVTGARNCLEGEMGLYPIYFQGRYDRQVLLKDLGKFKIGKACIYIKKLSDINQEVLGKMIKETIGFLQVKYK